MTRRQKRIDRLCQQISEQRKWILRCGGSRAGYIANYGDPGVPPLAEDGKPKILSIKPCDVYLFDGKYEPVPGQPNHFYATHSGNGGSAIFEADNNHLVQLETEYEILTGRRA